MLAQEQSLHVSFGAQFDPIPADCKLSAIFLIRQQPVTTAINRIAAAC
jgi:hypothetical protein